MTAWNNQTITYDGIGNPTNYLGATLEWQGGRQLKGMTSGNNILSFAYNDSGLRTEKTITHANSGLSETKQYIWNGSRLVAEIGEEYSFYFHYNGAGEMIGFTYRVEDNGSGSPDEAEHIFVKNQQGDVEKVLRPWDQAVVAEYSYDAWGNLLDWSGPLAERNPIRYRGYYYDTETGFYYLQSRYYDPQTGRFINADGLITTSQGLMSYNMFAYCLDNSVNYSDNAGSSAEAVEEWGIAMSWLPVVDGPIPFGDIVYVIVLGVLAALDLAYSNTGNLNNNRDYYIEREIPSQNAKNLPAPNKVRIDMNHILSGHSANGKRGGPDKDRFPKWMTPQMIEKAIRTAYKNAHKIRPMQHSWENGKEVVKQLFRGYWDYGEIVFWFNYTTNTIETAWPN